MANPQPTREQVVRETQRWLERAVIGLNLCPFAKAVHVKGQVHYAVCEATEVPQVLEDLDREVDALLGCAPEQRDTTLLVVPNGFGEFLLFQDLVRSAERRLARRKLEGVLQLASFHPRFVFGGAEADDVSNFTNRSPHPILHLLREASVERAVAAIPQPEAIYQANIATLERLGPHGWNALGVGPS